MNIPKLLSVGLTALAFASTAMAQTFFDQGITLQGKSIDLGNAGRIYKWAALTRDGNVTASDGSSFEGNVGVWGSSANLSLSGNAWVQGNVFIRQGGSASASGSSGWTGSKFQTPGNPGPAPGAQSILSTAATHIDLLSSNIASLTKTTNFSLSGFNDNTPSNLTKIIGDKGGDNTSSINLTINGTVNNPLNTPIVLKLTDFVLNNGGGTQLTLIGSATTKFIINVTNQFKIESSSDVLLSGGLLAGNVIFNYTGTNATKVEGGSTLKGILVAKNSAIQFSGGSIIEGQLIGKSVTLSGGSKVKKPKPSP